LNWVQVGDLFMSLIHTCQLCGANSFDYLIELQRHVRDLATHPRNGCRGTTARRWRGPLPSQIPPQSYDDATWPERIDCGHAWGTFCNGRQTGLYKGKIG
jgi:hypothetical protein